MALTACKSGRESVDNPLFSVGEWTTPFGVPPFDEIRSQHYLPAFERAMALHEAEIDAIVSNNDAPTFENVIEAYDAAGDMLSQVNLIFGMVSSADMTEELQQVQAEIMPRLAVHADKIGLNEALFAKVKQVYEQRGSLSLRPDQLRLVEKIYNDFVRSGALLEGEARERLKAINEELSSLVVRFGQNLLAENSAYRLVLNSEQLGGLPSGVRDAAKKAATDAGLKEGWAFTLSPSSMLPFLTYSTDRALREQIYTAYITRGNHDDERDNKAIINEMIRLRIEKAHLLGFESYAHYVTADQMAGNPAEVYELLDMLFPAALERAKGELSEMNQLLQQEQPGAEFEAWDWWYYAEKLRKQNYALDEEMLRPYFSLENSRDGIFYLANRLYGITFRPINVPHYHEECSAYEVLDADSSHLGVLYFDFHPRATKSGGAWCGYYREQSYRDGKRVAPVVGIVCNFTRPTETAPALLTIDEVETLFHEFGHALHFLFHDVKYRLLEAVEGDFVELPSQIMENWAFEPEMLEQYATHYRTGEVIPASLQEKLRNASLFNQGFMTTELVAAALSDLEIHHLKEYTGEIDVNGFEREVLNQKRGLIKQIAPRYRYPYFSHIFDGGYSSGYYFYVWAELLDKDAFEYFRQSPDLFNRDIAEKFRREVLARGGEADGMTLYRNFRGAEPEMTPMLKGRGLWQEPEIEPELEEVEMPDPNDF